jgi:hypothetical protein
MDTKKHVKVGELEIPTDYFNMNPEDRKELCLLIIDTILTVLDKHINPEFNRISILNTILDSSILTNVEDENYEIAQVLYDIKQIVNE